MHVVIIQKVQIHRKDASTGEINHEATVIPSFFQLTSAAVRPEMPAPTKAPITVCVHEMGMPNSVEKRMKKLKLDD